MPVEVLLAESLGGQQEILDLIELRGGGRRQALGRIGLVRRWLRLGEAAVLARPRGLERTSGRLRSFRMQRGRRPRKYYRQRAGVLIVGRIAVGGIAARLLVRRSGCGNGPVLVTGRCLVSSRRIIGQQCQRLPHPSEIGEGELGAKRRAADGSQLRQLWWNEPRWRQRLLSRTGLLPARVGFNGCTAVRARRRLLRQAAALRRRNRQHAGNGS